ncbi:hypothetical protein J7W19_00650 [Streptomyces mobaraensis NBRC 13819 = DSM 40847]|uniref:Uncharacterized protein n=1 Tax=Streptomyces mobaraensis (strain ATCC 29032 / DSM 40847 / JCM 4168 / NBRC 13819 / NCIMB 11159 / IPCR 16-22) TaxID=1223523 RepID=M3A8N9_STRM1|nr:hypothetical protein [Streptomyces mobaraensis]EMF01514.1 hypothetical protein H340_05741 [Streptomyces mobaraensis NBRC 13819 = DSM 40847]QTT72138.1 hypothetical protein J7W19_00650 [Streptomyces mobaraensis NBRC 13819 = DSM 40847]
MFDVMAFGQFHRLEPAVRPYGTGGQLDEALAARVADPLFLLARQWQTAEFAGEDSGSPVWCRIGTETTPLDAFRAGGGAAAVPLPKGVPLEYLAEAGAAPADALRDLPLRAAARAGRRFLDTLRTQPALTAALDAVDEAVLAKAPLPALPADPEKDPLRRDPGGQALRAVLAHRAPDGVALAGLLGSGWHPPDLTGAQRTAFDQAAQQWLEWFKGRHQPPVPSSWVRERLEHRFAVTAAPGGRPVTLSAPEYTGGTAEAYEFDLDAGTTPLPAPVGSQSAQVLPTRVTYPGMPAERWWEFEDATVNLPAIGAGAPDLARLLVVEFANLYGNDHWMIPVELATGALHRLTGLTVVDTFGGETAVDPVEDRHWSVFRLTDVHGGKPGPPLLPLLPTASARVEGAPVEEVLFARDEMANLAFAIERIVPSATGRARARGDEPSDDDPQVAPTDPAALAYRLVTAVPAHWIPLVPVPLAPDSAAVCLRRGQIPRFGPNGDRLPQLKAAGRILEPEVPRVFFRDEEVPRSGVTARRVPVVARDEDGTVRSWVGRRVGAGRGEASSALAFDGAVPPGGTG